MQGCSSLLLGFGSRAARLGARGLGLKCKGRGQGTGRMAHAHDNKNITQAHYTGKGQPAATRVQAEPKTL
jgi:hypothetical protein